MSERNLNQGSVNPQDQVHQPMNPMGHPTTTILQESSLNHPTSFGSSNQQSSFNAFGQNSVNQPNLVSQLPNLQPPSLSNNTNQQILTTSGETISLNKTCCRGTCNPIEDAERIRKALKGIANDEHPLIEILGRRPNTHMQRVREEYEKLYHSDLLSKVKSEIKSVYKCLAVALIKSHPEYKADLIYKSLKENKHYESEPFVNWIVADDPRSLEETKHHFRTRYSMSLTDFVKSCTKGRFKRLLLKSLEGRRSNQIQPELIETDVQMLCGEGRRSWGSEEILDLFTLRSREHLVLLSQRFEQRFNVSLERTIINETKSFFQSGILACLEPPSIYWSKRLYQGFKDLEVSDCLLVCCFSQLSKPFLQQVSVQYQKIFNISLQDEIKKHTSGYYCELLLTLIDCPETEKTQYNWFNYDQSSINNQTEKRF